MLQILLTAFIIVCEVELAISPHECHKIAQAALEANLGLNYSHFIADSSDFGEADLVNFFCGKIGSSHAIQSYVVVILARGKLPYTRVGGSLALQ